MRDTKSLMRSQESVTVRDVDAASKEVEHAAQVQDGKTVIKHAAGGVWYGIYEVAK